MKRRRTVLAPIHWTERIRQILYLVAYVAFVEYSYPTPFIQSRFGALCYAIIVFYVGKVFWRMRQERSPRFYKQTQRWHDQITAKTWKLTDYTRYRLMRIIRYAFVLYAVGWLMDGVSDSCSGAIQCVGNIPFMLVNNWQQLLYFMLQLALSMSTIFLMMWFLARMDLHRTILPDSIDTRFDDVYGQDKAVASLREMQGIISQPETVEAKGGYMPGGVLMYGPPGTGKTLMAEAFAGETSVPFVAVGPESFTNMFVGVPVMKVKMLFRHLRKLSVKHGGVVCFFDEIDALGSRGGGVMNQMNKFLYRMISDNEVIVTGGGAAGSGALQMLLTEMSGIAKPKGIYNKIRVFLGFKPLPPPNYRILWIGATNMIDALDPALLRPGRFDRKIKVSRPQKSGVVETFKGYLGRIDNNVTDEQIEQLARIFPDATGASIKDAVNEGLLKSIREGRDSTTYLDVSTAMQEKLFGETEGRMDLEEDRWRVAVHEAAHAVASHHFRPEAPIQFASVEKRGHTGGMVRAVDEYDRFTLKSRMIADIKVSLASRWAEDFYFDGNISTGPSSDLEKATQVAERMFLQFAMGKTVYVWGSTEPPAEVMLAVEDWLWETYQELEQEMYGWRDQVELIAQLLDEQGTVDGTEVHALLERMS